MAKELESHSQQVTSEDPWHEGDGDPWEKTNESLKVSDSPVSEDGTKKVTSPLQTEEGTDTTEKKDDQGVTGGAAAGSSQDVKREDPETEDTKREDTKTEDAKKDDATETREVKEETKVDSRTTHTPGPRPKTLWPTPKEGSWWSSSPLRQWYDGTGRQREIAGRRRGVKGENLSRTAGTGLETVNGHGRLLRGGQVEVGKVRCTKSERSRRRKLAWQPMLKKG